MLQPIYEDRSKTKSHHKHLRTLVKELRPRRGAKVKRDIRSGCYFTPYTPQTDYEYTVNDKIDFTGVYISDACMCTPCRDVQLYSHSRGWDGSWNSSCCNYGLCDNASQAIDYYYNVFLKEEDFGGLNNYTKEQISEMSTERINALQERAKRWETYHKGNHIICLAPMFDFRWHKWGPYIGKFNHKCEYFTDEKGIKMVYAFHIMRVW